MFCLFEAFVKENPTAIRPLSFVPSSNVEAVQGNQSTTKNTSRVKKTVHEDNDSLDEGDVSPLIRKKGKGPMVATSSRSIASQSILDQPTSERRPNKQKIGMCITWGYKFVIVFQQFCSMIVMHTHPYAGRKCDTCVDALLVDVADIDDFARLR